MLSVQSSSSDSRKCIPNIIPCRISHDGPLPSVNRFWTPEKAQGKTCIPLVIRAALTGADGTATAFFRGRKLQGKSIPMPEGYRGVVIQSTDKALPKKVHPSEEVEEDDDEPLDEVKIAEEVASFDEIMIWGHESVPADAEDVYVRGVNEWIQFAEAMHSGPDQSSSDKTQ